MLFFFFSSRRRHTRYWRDWSSDVCSSDLPLKERGAKGRHAAHYETFRGTELQAEKRRDALLAMVEAGQVVRPEPMKIGRGAGGERVEVLGVGGSFKKKKSIDRRYSCMMTQ